GEYEPVPTSLDDHQFRTSDSYYGFLNDLWRYNLTSNEWTWLSGSIYTDKNSFYHEKGVPHPDNVPGARYGGCLWEDSNGAIWLFGGYGYSTEDEGIFY